MYDCLLASNAPSLFVLIDFCSSKCIYPGDDVVYAAIFVAVPAPEPFIYVPLLLFPDTSFTTDVPFE